MTRAEQLEFCKVCLNQKFNPNLGIVCGLTDQPADFQVECADFKPDEEKQRAVEIGRAIQQIEDQEVRGENKGNLIYGVLLFIASIVIWVMSDGGVYAYGAFLTGLALIFSGGLNKG
ncbi:MAG: hypothetical protein JJ975_07160 [Bacteroidia bacterium]|nr:hypothetical protein [Bacteroidia bacterium]